MKKTTLVLNTLVLNTLVLSVSAAVAIALGTMPAFAKPATAVASGDEWATPAEKSSYRTTPSYAETMAYIARIANAQPGQVKVEPFGKTGEGRELDVVIVSKDGEFDPQKIHAARRPVLLVQNAIHSGEIEGTDACLALLRDLVVSKTKATLLDRAVFVFIPIYNADGHERASRWNRINQNGPEEQGWRANGMNLNLNRDYLKADAPETRAFLSMFHRWLPDFFIDDHVTDGADYQYDVTFTIDAGPDVSRGLATWISGTATPFIEHAVDDSGHLASPTYINLIDDIDPSKGLGFNADPPRFSTGYMILENRPGMLVEMHMLKDYKTRVTGNYEALAAVLKLLNRDADKLIDLNQQADAEAVALGAHPLANNKFPLATDWDGTTTPFLFRGYQYTRKLSELSGAMWIAYSHTPMSVSIPFQESGKVTLEVAPPAAYIIPAQWTKVIDVLAAHQVEIKRTTADWKAEVETYKCHGMHWQAVPFEGRHPIFNGEGGGGHPGKFGDCVLTTATRDFPAGSAVVELNQRLSKVAIQWLEPYGPDSAMAWDFFDPIFEQKEYGEFYVLERMGRDMLSQNPQLKAEFERKIAADPQFAGSPAERLEFFYEHSPYFEQNRVGEYPVGRLLKLDAVPLAK